MTANFYVLLPDCLFQTLPVSIIRDLHSLIVEIKMSHTVANELCHILHKNVVRYLATACRFRQWSFLICRWLGKGHLCSSAVPCSLLGTIPSEYKLFKVASASLSRSNCRHLVYHQTLYFWGLLNIYQLRFAFQIVQRWICLHLFLGINIILLEARWIADGPLPLEFIHSLFMTFLKPEPNRSSL